MEMQLSQRSMLKTTLSKELTQAISLLQYSSIDLLSYIEEQAIQNPLIKVEKKEESCLKERLCSKKLLLFL
ncbi:hypothetical protein [Peribacillus sp. TH14]|uniref:hypothetical protein n=1 Tax=Peribacillus sp. TH14 TaxID=2798481 RepID=UPI0019113E71|nr:hypothetical protein [Peribacillus sp. TH14]MBK5501377.1 hypothetical protein [Peribacillus sp. TH14]